MQNITTKLVVIIYTLMMSRNYLNDSTCICSNSLIKPQIAIMLLLYVII